MYDTQNFQYNVNIYQPCNELSFSFSDLQIGFFNARPQKPEPITGHSGQVEDQQVSNVSQRQENLPTTKSFCQQMKKKPKIIEISQAQLFRLKKYKCGRPKEIKNINQIFKTETLFYLNMLTEFKILSDSEKSWVQSFKQETLSAASFSKLMEKQLILEKLKEFYTSTELVKRILTAQRLIFPRKLEVIKHINFCLKLTDAQANQLKK